PSHTSKSQRHVVFLALSRGHGVLHGVLLGPPPSLRALRLCFRTLVRTLHRYYAAVRLLTGVHERLRLSPSRSVLLSFAGASEVSRFSYMLFLRVRGVFDYAGFHRNSRYRFDECCLPLLSTGSASQLAFSQLYS